MPKRRNKRPFIVIEALDAGGSQTQTDALCRKLKRRGYKPLQLHFPHEDRATGRLIYDKFLLSHNRLGFSRREQALLYIQDFFSRKEDIEKALAGPKNSLVVSDRFYTSTMAYQTAGLSGLNRDSLLEWIRNLVEIGQPALPRPTLVIFLDTSPGTSLVRLKGKTKDYHENLKRLTLFRASYRKLAREYDWAVVNSMVGSKQRSIRDIHEEIWGHVLPLIKGR